MRVSAGGLAQTSAAHRNGGPAARPRRLHPSGADRIGVRRRQADHDRRLRRRRRSVAHGARAPARGEPVYRPHAVGPSNPLAVPRCRAPTPRRPRLRVVDGVLERRVDNSEYLERHTIEAHRTADDGRVAVGHAALLKSQVPTLELRRWACRMGQRCRSIPPPAGRSIVRGWVQCRHPGKMMPSSAPRYGFIWSR